MITDVAIKDFTEAISQKTRIYVDCNLVCNSKFVRQFPTLARSWSFLQEKEPYIIKVPYECLGAFVNFVKCRECRFLLGAFPEGGNIAFRSGHTHLKFAPEGGNMYHIDIRIQMISKCNLL